MIKPRPTGLAISTVATLIMLAPPVLAAAAPPAYQFDLPAESLGDALRSFGQTSNQQIIFSEATVRGLRSPPLVGSFRVDQGLQRLLSGTGLTTRQTSGGVIYIESAETNGPPSPPTAAAAPLVEVVVTGSRISQPANATQAAPMTVISGTDIGMRGFNQVGQMLNLVTSNAPEVPVSQAEGYPAGSGQTNPDLFGIGDSRTLSLIDGVRMVTSESGLGARTLDVNVLPTGLIQRVEIDEAGGAAVYGSDAIAGVVNYVLKQDFQGLVVDGTMGVSSRSDYRTPGLSVTFGRNFADGRGNLAVDLEWSKSDPILETERPPFDEGWGEVSSPIPNGVPPEIYVPNVNQWTYNTNGVIFNSASSYYYGLPFLPSPAGLLQVNGGPAQFSPDGSGIIPYDTGIIQAPTGQAIGGQGYPNTMLSTLLAGVQRYTGAVIGHFDLTDHLKIANQFLWGREAGSDPLGTEGFINYEGGSGPYGPIPFYDTNPYLSSSEVATLEAADPSFATGSPLYLSKFSNWLPDARNDRNFTDTWREMLTLSGDSTAWNRDFTWSVLDAYGQTDSKQQYGDVYVSHFSNAVDPATNSAGQIVCAVNAVAMTDPACQPIDIFGSIPGMLQSAARDYISTVAGQWYRNTLNDVLATVGGDVIRLPAGNAKFNVTYEHRNESAQLEPFESQLLGIGTQGVAYPNSAGYYTNEGAAELLIPLAGGHFSAPFVKHVVLHGAFRTVDNSLSGHNQVWDSDLRWDVGYGITFRGTKSSNFSQPTLGELIQPATVGYLPAADPCDYQNINGGPNPAIRRANCTALFGANPGYGSLSSFYDPSETSGTVAVTSRGNPALKPEVSDTVTFGVVFKPKYIPGLTLSADRIQIKLSEALEQFQVQNFLDTCYDSSPQPASICDTFSRTPQGFLQSGLSEYFNAGSLRYFGEVYKADYLLPLDGITHSERWGILDFSAEATHNDEQQESVTGFDHTWYQGTIAEPSWVARFDLRYAVGHMRVLYSMYWSAASLIGPGANITNSPEPIVIRAVAIHSISMEYDLGRVTLRGGVQDLGDQLPAFAARSYGDIAGEEFYLGLRAKLF